ncbi:MAG TPA: purine-nucleoside phosphorylase [Actinomycetota bacterium]|jgi:inosine/guanosine/xanthosine phosphorylase family protein|nr:purine-nucleoside phosphorylase [Actinomycetota bacterium]
MNAEAFPSPRDGVDDGIVASIRSRTDAQPVAGVVLGSGLGETIRVAKEIAGATEGVEIAYTDLPGFPPPSVKGHAGKLWIGDLGGRTLAIFQGRIHYYEGHGMPLASITTRVSRGLGARTMVLTTAVGALELSLAGGTLVVVRDHLNLMGANPLTGWRMPDGSPAFVDVAGVYDAELSASALAVAQAQGSGVTATEGVYGAVPGPSYETPAETEFMRRGGATVVGMSMVPEAVAARALGMRVLGLSFVTNAAGAAVSHDEVLAASDTAAAAIGRVLVELVEKL